MYHELYKILVVMHKVISYEYFMDEMQTPEIGLMTKYLEYAEVQSWAQTRQIMLATIRPYLKKRNLTVSELLPLPIDNDGVVHTTEVKKEDINWFRSFKEAHKKGEQ